MALGFLVAGALMDGADGVVARYRGITSVFGGILDSTVDRITEIVWYLGCIGYYLHMQDTRTVITGVVLVICAATGSLMVSYIKARCEAASIACKTGLLQRPERIVIMAVILLMTEHVRLWGFGILAAGSYLTACQRLVHAWVLCRQH
jgi:CDP-diacylglycerol--glycerol-3-phosphate 3-phosphatidyltransferase